MLRFAPSRVLLFLCLAASTFPAAAGDDVSFRNEVMAVLSKAGCNSGPCHGNLNGKGGLKLSLRGQDVATDFRVLTREPWGRRIDRLNPDQSLLLLKPSGRVAHQGGVRFDAASREYQLIRDWIAAGANESPAHAPRLKQLKVEPRRAVLIEPESTLRLRTTALFTDGSERDVSDLVTYETSNLLATVSRDGEVARAGFGESTVIARYLDQQVAASLAFISSQRDLNWKTPIANNAVDVEIFRKLRSLRIEPSPLADDTTFLRRVFQDLLGVPPTADEAREFAADMSPDKRERWIERLLARPEFNELWALRWSDLLRNEEKVLDVPGVEAFHRWLKENVATSKPLDAIARELLTARGSTFSNPPANFYRANRDPATRGETAARLFLGVRLQCAQCHNHPFDRWTQDDYYSWAALFSRIDYEIGDNKRKDKLDKNEFVGDQVVTMKNDGEFKNARTGKDAVPAFLGSKQKLSGDAERLEQLAQWLTDPANRRFAHAQVNWIWFHLLGRGLVEPIDDFRVTNPPSHPQLLDELADDFVAGGFDLRRVVRRIVTSRTYQLSSLPNDSNREDENNFSRALVRRLRAEQVLDAQAAALDAPVAFNGYKLGLRAGQIPGVMRVRDRDQPPSAGDRFLALFGKPARLLACECERSSETTLSQAFFLIGSQDLESRLASDGNFLDRLVKSGQSPTEMVAELYWRTLSRSPSPTESTAAVARLLETSDLRNSLQDLAWALLNSKEFLFRR